MLAAPEINQPINECSVAIGMRYLVPGAKVTILSNELGTLGTWDIMKAREEFALPKGVALRAGSWISAFQSEQGMQGFTSSSVVVGARPTPAELSNGSFASPIHECAECIFLYQATPGAKVVVYANGQELLGDAVVRTDGSVSIRLGRPVKATDRRIEARLSACDSVGGVVSASNPIVTSDIALLDTAMIRPTRVSGIRECATSLQIEEGMSGTHLVLTRHQPGQTPIRLTPRCLATIPRVLGGFQPFRKGERIRIETFFSKCGRSIGPPIEVDVDGAVPKAPTFLHKICDNAARISLGSLEVNAVLEMRISAVNGSSVELKFGCSSEVEDFPLYFASGNQSALSAGMKIQVRQSLCRTSGSWSPSTSATVLSSIPGVPVLSQPFNNSTGVSRTPLLMWSDTGIAPCSGAKKYDIRIGISSAMAAQDIVFQTTNGVVGAALNVPPGVLAGGKKYFWQARAYNPQGVVSNWSSVFVFTTLRNPSPPDGPDGGEGGEGVFYFCQICPGFDRGKTIRISAQSYSTAYQKALENLPDGCFLNDGPCSD